MVFYFPTHAPDAPERGPGGTFIWRFTESLYLRARLAAGGLIAVGLLFAFHGMVFKPAVQVVCKRCRLWVVATRDGISLKCPRVNHVARSDRTTILMAALLIAAVVGVVLSISFGSIVRAH